MRCLCEAVVQHIKLKSEGNTIQASLLVKFLHQQSAVLMSKQMQPRTDGEHSASIFHNSFANSTVKESSVTRKRSHDVAVVLDPAFEQAFKRQRQPPPTPPRSKSIHRMVE